MRALTDPAARFSSVYRATYPDVLRYAKRRSDQAEDVAAETFTTAWRRIDDLPKELDDARAWLFGIARNTLLNARRSTHRQTALAIRLDSHPDSVTGDDSDLAVAGLDVARAWDQLSPDDQEAIALAIFDGLDAARAAQVLGITAVAYRNRLSRARARLRTHIEAGQPNTSPVLSLTCSQESR